jgi:hypothetical protein
MIHDFCGGLEEEMMRTNFIMIYELIDELIVRKPPHRSKDIFPFSTIGLRAPSDYSHRDAQEVCAYTG